MESIENMYFFMHSGDKFISPYVEKYIKIANTLGEAVLYMAKDFWYTYRQQLFKQWENFTREYDPANNYSVHEVTHYDHTGGSDSTDSGTDTVTKNGSVSESGAVTTSNKVWSFDSTQHDFDETTVEKGAAGTSGIPTTTFNNVADSKTYGKRTDFNESADDDLTTDKSGVLGVSSISQLVQADIELWKRNFFTTIFFPMLDKVLTLSIY